MGGTSAVLGTLITTLSVPSLTQTGYIGFFVLAAILVPLSYISLKIFSDKNLIDKTISNETIQ
jgi:ACS family hexuronate transporter-like MFS transporter